MTSTGAQSGVVVSVTFYNLRRELLTGHAGRGGGGEEEERWSVGGEPRKLFICWQAVLGKCITEDGTGH
jgi:hypothetical protein